MTSTTTQPAGRRPKYYVATYGDMGIEIEFFSRKRDFKKAEREAKEGWTGNEFDTWQSGDVPRLISSPQR
ncbi:MAG: hypothetical protein ACXWML_09850 [Candidatus Binataceae bacterium]